MPHTTPPLSLLVFFPFLMPLFVLSPPSSRRCRRQRRHRRSWHSVRDSGRLPKGFRTVAVSYSVPQLMRQTSVRTQRSSRPGNMLLTVHTCCWSRVIKGFFGCYAAAAVNAIKHSGNMLLTAHTCCRSLSLAHALSELKSCLLRDAPTHALAGSSVRTLSRLSCAQLIFD